MKHSKINYANDVKVLGRVVSISTDNKVAEAEQVFDTPFIYDEDLGYPRTNETKVGLSQYDINRLLKRKVWLMDKAGLVPYGDTIDILKKVKFSGGVEMNVDSLIPGFSAWKASVDSDIAYLKSCCQQVQNKRDYLPSGGSGGSGVTLTVRPSSINMTVGDPDVSVSVTSSPQLAGNYTLTSNNTSVATIVSGKVHAVSAGNTTITVDWQGLTKSIPVTVSNPAPVLNDYTVTYIDNLGGSTTLATQTVTEGSVINPIASPSNKTVGGVTYRFVGWDGMPAGRIMPSRNLILYAEWDPISNPGGGDDPNPGGGDEPETPTDKPVTNVSIDGADTVTLGSNATYTARITPSDANVGTSLTWSTNNGQITSSGVYTPETVGTATITVTTSNGILASKPITVIEQGGGGDEDPTLIPAESIRIMNYPSKLPVGGNGTITAQILPDTANSGTEITWTANIGNFSNANSNPGTYNAPADIDGNSIFATVTVTTTNGLTDSRNIEIYKLGEDTPTEITVSFYDGDTEYLNYRQTIPVGSVPTKPTDPQKDNKLFLGWYIGDEFDDNLYQFEEKLYSDTIMHAYWGDAIPDPGTTYMRFVGENAEIADYDYVTASPGSYNPLGNYLIRMLTTDSNGFVIKPNDGYKITGVDFAWDADGPAEGGDASWDKMNYTNPDDHRILVHIKYPQSNGTITITSVPIDVPEEPETPWYITVSPRALTLHVGETHTFDSSTSTGDAIWSWDVENSNNLGDGKTVITLDQGAGTYHGASQAHYHPQITANNPGTTRIYVTSTSKTNTNLVEQGGYADITVIAAETPQLNQHKITYTTPTGMYISNPTCISGGYVDDGATWSGIITLAEGVDLDDVTVRMGETTLYRTDVMNGNTLSFTVTADATITFAVSASRIMVDFDPNNGENIIHKFVDYGDQLIAVKPSDPNKNGYTFNGWHVGTETGEVWNMYNEVTESMTLVAGWDNENTSQYDLVLDKTSITMGKGEYVQITATPTYLGSPYPNTTPVTWTVDNTNIVMSAADGTVRSSFTNAGNATVTATWQSPDGPKTKTCKVTVTGGEEEG